jgi:hypothetical protein
MNTAQPGGSGPAAPETDVAEPNRNVKSDAGDAPRVGSGRRDGFGCGPRRLIVLQIFVDDVAALRPAACRGR